MDYNSLVISLWALFIYQFGIGIWAETRREKQIDGLENRISRLEDLLLYDDSDDDGGPDGDDGERVRIVS